MPVICAEENLLNPPRIPLWPGHLPSFSCDDSSNLTTLSSFQTTRTRRDGSFEVNNLPPGSYIVDVLNPNYVFEPLRVDINSKGKIRARKLNLLQPNVVQQVPYPMRFKPKIPFKYFQVRESWKITDILFNPMVLMMVLPMLLIMTLSKTVNMSDAETQKVGS